MLGWWARGSSKKVSNSPSFPYVLYIRIYRHTRNICYSVSALQLSPGLSNQIDRILCDAGQHPPWANNKTWAEQHTLFLLRWSLSCVMRHMCHVPKEKAWVNNFCSLLFLHFSAKINTTSSHCPGNYMLFSTWNFLRQALVVATIHSLNNCTAERSAGSRTFIPRVAIWHVKMWQKNHVHQS